ncbi:hypothetical protein Glove_174g126 [Diversispora epigaea]|uniref:Uncharacterized protein n=1 Tax=Diversispora epigaea TaxID=1348612 RepID=A0A397INY2_9GLOM|nr:hypothetical protein Glove_174g126 [Diversispora epigaea]
MDENDNSDYEDYEDLEEIVIEYDEAYLEQLINSEESILLNAETDNSTYSTHKIIQNQERNSSSSDDEIENENINNKPNSENRIYETLSNLPLLVMGNCKHVKVLFIEEDVYFGIEFLLLQLWEELSTAFLESF